MIGDDQIRSSLPGSLDCLATLTAISSVELPSFLSASSTEQQLIFDQGVHAGSPDPGAAASLQHQ